MATYTINAPGAKTLADARRYMIDGKPVTAEVTIDTIVIFVGCEIVHTAPNTNSLHTIADVAAYVIATLAAAPVKVTVTEDAAYITVTIEAPMIGRTNFGHKAAGAARKAAGAARKAAGGKVWRMSSYGSFNFPVGRQTRTYVYARG